MQLRIALIRCRQSSQRPTNRVGQMKMRDGIARVGDFMKESFVQVAKNGESIGSYGK